MKAKVGDLVICTSEDFKSITRYKVYRIKGFRNISGVPLIKVKNDVYFTHRFNLLIPYDKLNSSLYPDSEKITYKEKEYLQIKNFTV